MSKYLVKILSVCALVVLLAVTIVGATIGITEAVAVTLTVIDTTATSETESNVKIYVNDKEQTENKITVAKYTEVKLVFNGLEKGYKFDGWYNGESIDRENAQAVSKDTEYKFDVDKTMTISAIADLKSYTVTFTGKMPDGTTDVTKPITEGGAGLSSNMTYIYGQELPVIPGTDTLRFDGWKIDTQEETEGATTYTTAIFDKDIVTLKPAYTNQALTEYSLKIKKSAIEDEVIANLSFNKNNPAVYIPTRQGYTLKGVMYNGELRAYNYESHTFPDLYQYVSTGTETDIEVYAVWECDYTSISLKFNGMAYYTRNGKDAWYGVLANSEPMESGDDPYYVQFVDGLEEGNADLEDNIFELFFNNFSSFTTLDGREVEFSGKIRMTVDGQSQTDSITLQATQPYKYSYLELLLNFAGKDIDGKVITITFLFDLVD